MGATVTTATDTAVSTASDAGFAFATPQATLKAHLATLARVADAKSTMAMLRNVLMRVDRDGATLVATDLNLTVIVRLTDAYGSRGGYTLPCKPLADLVKSLPDGEIKVRRASITACEIASGNLSSVIYGTPDRDFPRVPDDQADDLVWSELRGKVFSEMLDRVLFAVCKDETRFHLNGVWYENPSGDHVTLVSTDGHRLTRLQSPFHAAKTSGVIIPAKAANEIVKLLARKGDRGCMMAIKGCHLFVRHGETTLITKLIDAQFPPYEQVIPKDNGRLCTIERKPLLASLKRAAKLYCDGRGVKFTLADQKVQITTDHPDLGTNTESLPAEGCGVEGHGSFSIGFNPRYLIDAITEIDCDHVTFAFDGAEGKKHDPALSPALVCSTHEACERSVPKAQYLNVVMPMRI